MKTLVFINGPMGLGKTAVCRALLERLGSSGMRLFQYTLLCSEQTLRQRIEADIQAGARREDVLERSLRYLPLYGGQDTVKIMTDGRSAQETAEIIVGQMTHAARHP